MPHQDILRLVQEKEVRFVDFRFTDLRGQEHHISVPAHLVDADRLREGQAFDGSSIAGWKGIQASDMLLVPDPTTARLDPFFDESTL
ncbi:MAG TPA: glutamine synthetase beta-grasp domain-containing protein, partial [Thiobacillaceae bacterium]|nr:glutamine synthetase beta-grasp domain-containing protein [Thiobacillaceae bacterium]HNU65432.1 glutamine synthetase beta-grasp domain-containing protein [Thiobacillaceae bacterium]